MTASAPSEIRRRAAAMVERTRREQGLPPKVEDRVTLQKLAVILSSDNERVA